MTDIEEIHADDVAEEDFLVPADADPMVPLIAGTVAIYPDGKGGLVMVFMPEGADEPIRKRVPGGALKLMAGGPVGKMLGGIFGGGGN